MNIQTLRFVVLTLSLFSFLLPTSSFAQGSLTPPGAPAPTMKSLDQIEPRTPISSLPFTISSPGNYYLTRSLTPSAGGGITINASFVTLDLNGFTLLAGNNAADTAGIVVGGTQADVVIRNGTISGWQEGAVAAGGVTGGLFEKLAVTGNFGSAALTVGNGCAVRDCTAHSNFCMGITSLDGCVVTHCVCYQNLASVNGSPAGGGFLLGNKVTITDSNADGNLFGISVGDSSLISRCTASGNQGYGISTGTGCSVADCAMASNTSHGLIGGGACVIRDCTATANSIHGITMTNATTVRNCVVENNGQAGIQTNGFGNRIEGNETRDQHGSFGSGIKIDRVNGLNIVIRNTAGNNTINYDIASGNGVGPIISVSGGALSSSTNSPFVNTQD
jgi:hypothetical protein